MELCKKLKKDYINVILPNECTFIGCDFGTINPGECKVNDDCFCKSRKGLQECRKGNFCYLEKGCLKQKDQSLIKCGVKPEDEVK